MALFKSQEQKAEAKAQKEQELLERYGLQNLNNPDDLASVRKIVTELAGSGMMEFGNMLAPDEKTMLRLQVSYQRALIEQNFILIRQLDKITSRLK